MPEFTWAVFPLLGIVAGVLAGLLGIGGGIVLVAALVVLLPWFGVPALQVMHVALATSLASIIVTASASANAHRQRGSVLWPTAAWLAPGLVLGGIAGSMAWPSRSAMAPATDAPAVAPVPRGPWLGVAGVVIGAVSAVVGIGGGSLTVPLLVSRGVATVRAVGTSSACGVVIALASAATYALAPPHGAAGPTAFGMVGHVHVPAAVGIGLGAWFAAPYGVRLAHRLSGVALARVFAVALAAVGVALLSAR
jgi:uncharacterized protein